MRLFAGIAILTVVVLVGCARPMTPAEVAYAGNVKLLRENLVSSASGSAAPAAATIAEPDGFATIKGRFKLVGEAPKRNALKVDKELEVCAPGGKTVLEESLVVSADGGIRDVAVFLFMPKFPIGDEKWEHSDYAPQRDAKVLFDQKQCVFLSHVFAMRTTQTLEIKNSDPVGHNTKIDHDPPANPTVPAGSSTDYRTSASSPQPVPVACSIHPWMSAYVLFTNTPLFAVTGEDGSFEIKNVPTGVDLNFRVWQEKVKLLPEVTVAGKKENWKKGFTRKLTNGQELVLDVEVDAAVFKK